MCAKRESIFRYAFYMVNSMSEAAAFPDNKQIFRVAFASIIGSVIEQ